MVIVLLAMGMAGLSSWILWIPARSGDIAAPHQEAPPGGTGVGTLSVGNWERLRWTMAARTESAAVKTTPVRVLMINVRQGRPLAGLDRGPGSAMTYLGVGETKDGIKVLRIDGRQVELEIDGQPQVQEVGR